MHNPFSVRIIERFGYLAQIPKQVLPLGHTAFGEHLPERCPIHVLHYDVRRIPLFDNVVYRHDVRMRQGPNRLSFDQQPIMNTLALGRIVECSQMNGFDRDGTTDSRIERLVNHAHRAATQLA